MTLPFSRSTVIAEPVSNEAVEEPPFAAGLIKLNHERPEWGMPEISYWRTHVACGLYRILQVRRRSSSAGARVVW